MGSKYSIICLWRMIMAKNKELWIDMCAGSELMDTQGETLSVEGADIDDLRLLNDNHGVGFHNSLGVVTESKKILKAEDCENERHKYYWEKIKAPYIYAKGYLHNNEDHPNAKAAAAILRNIHREDIPLRLKASVEGGVMARGIHDSKRLARTKIHSVALTFTPANNATLVEPLNLDKSSNDWQTDERLIKSVLHLAETNVPSFRHIQRHASANTIYENINKIKDLAKTVGIEIEIKKSEPESIMKQAAINKVANNIEKINALVKAMKSPSMGNSAWKQNPATEAPTFTSPGKVAMAAQDKQVSVAAATDKYQQNIGRLKSASLTPDKPADTSPKMSADASKVKTGKQFTEDNHFKRQASIAMRDPSHLDSLHQQLSAKGGKDKADAVIARIRSHIPSDLNKGVIKEGIKNAVILGALATGAASFDNNTKEKPKEIKEVVDNTEKYLNSPSGSSTRMYVDKSKAKDKIKKALMAGYGGAGAPTSNIGGGVVQMESLENQVKNVTIDNKKTKKKTIKEKLVKSLGYSEILEKGKKQLLQMYKPEHQEVGKQHVEWASKTLPSHLHEWAVKNHRNDHESFTPEIKETLHHFAGMQHAPDIAKVRMEPHDTFETGINKLNQAQEVHNKKNQSEEKRWITPSDKDVEKIKGSKRSWHDLNRSYCNIEGGAMEHCGNIEGQDRQTDRILSLRSKREVDGKEQHKPHLTFISNNGWLGETKGFKNNKPSKEYHEDIVNLLKHPHIKGVAGGGYQAENNFHWNDLSEEHKKEVLTHNPNLITHLDDSDNVDKALSGDLPNHHKATIAKNPNLDPKHHEKLLNDEQEEVRLAIASNPKLDPKHHEKLVNDKDENVRHTIAKNPNLDPKHYEKLLNDVSLYVRGAIARKPNLDPKHHERLVNDKDEYVRLAIANNPKLDPKHHEKLLNDKDGRVKQSIAGNPNLDPKHYEKLVNDEDKYVRGYIARNPNLDPKYHERLLNDEYSEVGYPMAGNPSLDPKHHEKLVNNEDWFFREAVAYNPNLNPKHQEKLVNDEQEEVRLAIAHNPKLDPKHYEKLLNDENVEVRDMAQKTLDRIKLNKSINKLKDIKEKLAKSFQYISCQNCGKEQIYMQHQVKCRECRKNFSFDNLKDFI